MMMKHFCPLVLLTLLAWLFLPDRASGQYYIHFPLTQPVELHADAGPDKVVAAGLQVTLGANPAAAGGTAPYGYLWSPVKGLDNPGLPNPLFQADSSRTYILAVTDSNLCSDSDTVNISVTAGIADEASGAVPFFLYPNPVTSGSLIIHWPDLREPVTIRLFSAQGRMCLETTLESVFATINLSHAGIVSGVYTLVVEGNQSFRFKFLVL